MRLVSKAKGKEWPEGLAYLVAQKLSRKFKPNDIKLAFAVLISKSDSNTDSYYPLPIVKAKLIESFVKLIFVTKSLMVSSSKKPTR